MTIKRTHSFLWTLLIGVLLASVTAYAQDATGRVIGTVTDAQGSVVPKAKIVVQNTTTGLTRNTVTGDQGEFQVLQLPIGTYTVSAEKAGFRKSISSVQQLFINASLHVDLKLEVGQITEVVQVDETATGVEVVNSTIGNSVTGNQIAQLPLNGRNALDLALLVPGVIPSSAGGAGSFSIAGGRQDSVTYLLDGGVNNNLLNNGVVYNPNPDTIAEFRVLTSNYSAEFGRNAGGIVSVVTKSGSNQFHGSAYDYVRNDAFNANSFFNNANGLPKEILKRNQFGGTLGGPVLLPKIVNGKDKLFFFFGYQGQRQSALNTSSEVSVFTPAELGGDFSKSYRGGPDPDVVQFLLDNPYYQPNPTLASQGVIAPNRFSAVAKNYIGAGYVPSAASGSMLSQGSAKSNNDEYTGKIDYQVTDKDRVSFTGGFQNVVSTSPFAYASVAGYTSNTFASRYYGTLAYTHTFTPNLLNDFRFTVQRNNNLQGVPATQLKTGTELGIKMASDDPHGPPNIDLLSSGLYLGFSVKGPTALIDNTYSWNDSMSWTHGRHTVKGGFTYTPYQNNTIYDYYVNGDFSFYGVDSNNLVNDKAAFLLGLADEYFQSPRAPSNIRTFNLGAYIQDDYRVTRRLTLNFGVRYEYNQPKFDTQSRSYSLLWGAQSTVFPGAPSGLLFPGDAQAPRGSNFGNKKDFAPRFGFAFDPQGNGKTSIRGGIGLFYDILKAEDNLQFNGQAPFFGYADLTDFPVVSGASSSAPDYFADPFGAKGATNPFPSKPVDHSINFDDAGLLPFAGSSVYFVNPKLKTPYVVQYNLSVQREIMRATTLEVAYLGSSSHRLTGLLDANPFVLGTTNRLFNTQPGVPSYAFSYIDQFDNVGYAKYNAMTVGLNRRTAGLKGVGALGYQVSYTYGKSIDNESGFQTGNGRVASYNWNQFKAVSEFDVKHYLSVNANWELPFAQWFSRAPKRLTKGWTLYPVVSYRSGTPLDIRAFINRSRTRPGPSAAGDPNLVHPNLVGTIQYYDPKANTQLAAGTGNYYFNPAAFSYQELIDMGSASVTNASLRTYGSLGRNAFRGPDRVNVDFTIGKVVPLWNETAKMEIKADFFNLLNHAEFDNPNLTITSAQFGQISSTDRPRIIQLSARFSF